MTPNTKIDLNAGKIARMEGLDDLARVLIPGNKRQQLVFIAIFVELKWAPGQSLPTLEPIAQKHEISSRTLETVRAKMRRLGIIDHVSRFSRQRGYREGWILSRRFERSLERLSEQLGNFKRRNDGVQEQKDRDVYRYI
jgi:DNA-binding transcriptional regulator YhcF (GntR family)